MRIQGKLLTDIKLHLCKCSYEKNVFSLVFEHLVTKNLTRRFTQRIKKSNDNV